jgi:RNA polymerase sigma-70 factor (ECF subfamily)
MAPPPAAFESSRTAQSQEWCNSLLRDGAQAQATVIESLRLFVYRSIHRTLHHRRGVSEALIEDLTQEATVRILNTLTSFRGDSQFTTWATTVAIRVALTELRHSRWKDVSLDQLLDGETKAVAIEPVAREPEIGSQSDRQDVLAKLAQAVKTELSDRQRQAIEAELAGMATVELAARLGTNHNALYKLLHDARKRLKIALEKMGVTEIDVRNALDA